MEHKLFSEGVQKIFVDIDETICFYENKRVYAKAIPSYENIAKINRLFEKGNHITYYTARGSGSGIDYYDLTKMQLDEWGCKYHDLSTGNKPVVDMFIDDKAYRIEEID
jgi:hydroxymethylpyrimidine pyrophosphatase-like HAD family hydrolase